MNLAREWIRLLQDGRINVDIDEIWGRPERRRRGEYVAYARVADRENRQITIHELLRRSFMAQFSRLSQEIWV